MKPEEEGEDKIEEVHLQSAMPLSTLGSLIRFLAVSLATAAFCGQKSSGRFVCQGRWRLLHLKPRSVT